MKKNKPLIISLLKLFLLEEQIEELQNLGNFQNVSLKNNSEKELFKKISKANILISKSKIINYKYFYDLQNMLIVIPFGKSDFLKKIDHEKLKVNNIKILHIEREYKQSVSEWIIFMMIALSRKLHLLINTSNNIDNNLQIGASLFGKNVTVLGKGIIGKHIGEICKVFGMKVTYFQRNDDIIEKTKNADFIINCLKNKTSDNVILNNNFFDNIHKPTFFISPASNSTYDISALKNTLKNNIVKGFADDVADAHIGDAENILYKTIKSFPNTIATPHIAWRTDIEAKMSYDKLIDAIKQYLSK